MKVFEFHPHYEPGSWVLDEQAIEAYVQDLEEVEAIRTLEAGENFTQDCGCCWFRIK